MELITKCQLSTSDSEVSTLNAGKADDNEKLNAALEYAAKGYPVFPLRVNSKVPATTNGYKDASTAEIDIRRWWKKSPDANIGIVTGEDSGLLVLDVDIKGDLRGDQTLEQLCVKHNALPVTHKVTTPSGGLHYYFKYPKVEVRGSVGKLGAGLDIRGKGGYIVAPTSQIDGNLYSWHDPDAQIADAPEWLVELACNNKNRSSSMPHTGHAVAEGQRNEHIFKLACRLRAQAIPFEEAEVLVLEEAAKCAPPLDDDEALAVLGSAYSYSEGPSTPPEIAELNEKYFSTMVGGKFVVMEERIDPSFGHKRLEYLSAGSFRLMHNNRRIQTEGGPKSLGSCWLEHQSRRSFNGIVFEPGRETEGYFNLWQGFAAEPKEGNCKLFLRHIEDNVADGNPELYRYIVAWMADLVQNPGNKPGTSLVLRGKQGTGKGIFVTEFGRLFGKHFVHLRSGKQLTGNFNAHLESALLVFADEAVWGGDKQSEGALKGLITEETMMVERKGVDALQVKNHVHLIAASNESWVVPAGMEERRFCVMDVSDKQQQDSEYFGAIVDQMDNGGREALLCYLQSYELDGINLRMIPQTEALLETKKQSMSPIQSFWLTKLEEGVLDPGGDSWGDGAVLTDTLYLEFVEHAKGAGKTHRPAKSVFGAELKKLIPGDLMKPRRMINGKRTILYEFPSLEECRAHFDSLMKTKSKWHSEEGGMDW